MRNSPGLPLAAIVAATLLAAAAALWKLVQKNAPAPLSELEIGVYAWALVLGIFGVQGLISVLLEGTQLRPGVIAPRMTRVLGSGIVLFSVLLMVLAILLGSAILTGQPVPVVGTTAAAGCLVLALLLVAYKEAFLGDEARIDRRKDGIPW